MEEGVVAQEVDDQEANKGFYSNATEEEDPLTTKEGSAAEVTCTASTQWKGGKNHHQSWKGISTSGVV